ncbi:MAG: LysM peptidoglycan-binding domain-containing protein [Ilumatobacteraceae bacterium]
MRQHRRAFAVALFTACTVIGQAALTTPAGAAPVTAVPTAYTVANGDSLWGISLKLKVSFQSLLTANNMTATSLILPGQQLIAPAGAAVPATTTATGGAKASSKTNAATTPPAAAPAAPAATAAPGTTAAPTSYTVVGGDYLYGIARNFAVPFSALLSANNFTATSAIFPGRPITIPAGATTTPKTTAVPTIATPATGAASNVVSPSTVPTVTIQPTTSQKVNVAPTGNSKLDTVIAFAIAQLGKPYVFAGAGPDTYDCSGLVLAAYAQAGVQLIHQSAVQSTEGTAVDWKTTPILPGDLVFTAGSATPGMISHVGMAINATQWVQSPRPNAGVQIGYLPASEKILAVRRFISN